MFEYDGYVQESVAAIIMLIVGVAIAVMTITLSGAIGGSVYEQVEEQLVDYNEAVDHNTFVINADGIRNNNIGAAVRNSIQGGFDALETTGDYMPIVVLAVMVSLVLALLINNLGGSTIGYGGGGYAL